LDAKLTDTGFNIDGTDHIFGQDGYAVIASDGPGEYPVIAEARAGNDGVGVTVTSGTVAYVTTGGWLLCLF
jgi:hypothetical protein